MEKRRFGKTEHMSSIVTFGGAALWSVLQGEADAAIELARLAVQTCLFPLWECEHGEYNISTPSRIYIKRPERKKPVMDYLKQQGRFRHLFRSEQKDILNQIQQRVDREWAVLLKRAGIS